MDTFYRTVGVYGACLDRNALLVIDKGRGPFKGKFDLHQIAILYRVTARDGNRTPAVINMDEDALDAHWIPVGFLNESNSSPIVLQACLRLR